jgi:predicted SprT family Zn-dependent metalloprotease
MYSIPRGWKLNTNKQLQEVYKKCCDKAIELELLNYMPKLYIFKSTRTWGWANYTGRYIGLNAVYLQDPEKAINTICHELAHLASPRGENHGRTWRYNFARIGVPFGLHRFERCSSNDDIGLNMPKNYRYEAYCPHCNKSWKRQNRVKLIQHPERYRCPACHETLKSREI